ncbi:DUF4876 domain-containing protein [Prolixibacteraceae bacterium JC049]|nr:DUF4876 domain-containing protein [Prolixibacteraceae bacterium JC049]
MNKLKLIFTLAIASTFALFSCSDSDDPIPTSNVTLTIQLPEGVTVSDYSSFKADLLNQSTQQTVAGTISDQGKVTATVEQGVYDITITGKGTKTTTIGEGDEATNLEQTVDLRSFSENTSISGDAFSLSPSLFINIESSGWVIKEIYFAGSKTPEGKSYYKDKYIEIYNNTDKAMYADGLCFTESNHTNSSSLNKWENILNEAYVAGFIFQIPGTGKEHPVQPGKSIVIADVGINHKAINNNSIDLSTADFEWYEEHKLDSDTPEVPNIDIPFKASATITVLNIFGYKAYTIFKPSGTIKQFLAANKVVYTHPNSGKQYTYYKVPNNLILDAVEIGAEGAFNTKAVSPQLDLSYINVGTDKTKKYSKVIRRKIDKNVNGRVIYKDTNDSAKDFEANVDPKPHVFN